MGVALGPPMLKFAKDVKDLDLDRSTDASGGEEVWTTPKFVHDRKY